MMKSRLYDKKGKNPTCATLCDSIAAIVTQTGNNFKLVLRIESTSKHS